MNPISRFRCVGRRGGILLILACADFVIAASLYFPAPVRSQTAATRWISELFPLYVWASLWLATGCICLWQAFRCHDRIGYAVASLIKVMWGIVHLLAAVVAGVPRASITGLIWLCIAAWLYVISTWPEVGRSSRPEA